MPTTIIEKRLIPEQHRELILLSNGHQTHQLYVSLNDLANRQSYIDEATALLEAKERELIDYAKATGHDLENKK
jgi:hypothetical protein